MFSRHFASAGASTTQTNLSANPQLVEDEMKGLQLSVTLEVLGATVKEEKGKEKNQDNEESDSDEFSPSTTTTTPRGNPQSSINSLKESFQALELVMQKRKLTNSNDIGSSSSKQGVSAFAFVFSNAH